MIRFLSLVGIVKAIVLSKIVEFGATNFVSFASISILLVFCCHITGINDVDPSECLKIRPSIVAASKMVVSNMKSLPKYAESTSSSRTMNLFEIVKQDPLKSAMVSGMFAIIALGDFITPFPVFTLIDFLSLILDPRFVILDP